MGRRAFHIRHRIPSVAKEIILSDKDRQSVVSILLSFYTQSKGLDDVSAKELIEKNIQESEAGWPRAPKDIFLRLEKKSGYKFTQDKEPIEKSQKKKSNKVVFKTIRAILDPEEAEWWDNRLKMYIDEFEFNKSSDTALLEQVVVEELIQKRLAIQQLTQTHVDSMASKTQSESTKRLLDMQEKLGITRKQREDSISNIDGNIASAALALDEKLAEIEIECKKQREEEDEMQAIKDSEPPVNVLPTEEKLLTMIGDLSLLPIPSQATAKITPVKINDHS